MPAFYSDAGICFSSFSFSFLSAISRLAFFVLYKNALSSPPSNITKPDIYTHVVSMTIPASEP